MPEPIPPQIRRPPPQIAERTRLDAPSAQVTAVGSAAAAVARLLVTAGPRKGAEFALAEALVTVGRGGGNGVVLADLSVSRCHSRLQKKRGGWVMLDQGSGNGTRVNGRAVRRRKLRHGDEIAMGDSRLRFLEPGGVIAWTQAQGEASRRRAHLCGAALVALAMVGAAAAVRHSRAQEVAAAEARAALLRDRAHAARVEATSLAKEGRWAEARDRLQVAAELVPGDAAVERSRAAADAEALRLEAAGREAPGRAEEAAAGSSAPVGTASVAPAAAAPARARDRKQEPERDPGDLAAASGTGRDAEEAREVYLRAYVLKEEDPVEARAMFERLALSLPAGSGMAEKARRWAQKLEGKAAP